MKINMEEKSKTKPFLRLVLEKDLCLYFISIIAWIISFTQITPDAWGNRHWLLLLLNICVPILFTIAYGFRVYSSYRLVSAITSTKHIPLVYVVGKPLDEARSALVSAQEAITRLTGFKDFHEMEEHFNIRYENLIFHKDKRLPPDIKEWKDFIEDAEQRAQIVLNSIPREKIYHVFINGPSSLALGLGAAFGCKRPVVVYQYTDEKYKPVINLIEGLRRIKQTADGGNYQYIRTSYPSVFTPDIAVVLDMASHTARGAVKQYLEQYQKQRNLKMEVVEVANTYGSNLTENDWIRVVQEIYSVFKHLQASGDVARIHLFHSMPVALAFGVGMALGNFVPITVYNWEREDETYYPTLKLNKLKSFV